MRRDQLWDRYARAIPPRVLRTAALPLGRHLQTDDGIRFEAVRMLNLAFSYVMNEGVIGDYAEFGVLHGRTFVEAWFAMERSGLGGSLHAYDSFQGLPETTAEPDRRGPFYAGQFASPRTTFDQITSEVSPDRMTVTEGFFSDALPTAEHHQLAVAWVDCDLYESTVPVLDFLTDQLQDGSVLIFDDWFCFHARPDRGEQLACQQWLDAHPELRLVPWRDYSWAGKAFIVNR